MKCQLNNCHLKTAIHNELLNKYGCFSVKPHLWTLAFEFHIFMCPEIEFFL